MKVEIIQFVILLGILISLCFSLYLLRKIRQNTKIDNRTQCYYCGNLFLPEQTEIIGRYTYCLKHGWKRQLINREFINFDGR